MKRQVIGIILMAQQLIILILVLVNGFYFYIYIKTTISAIIFSYNSLSIFESKSINNITYT